MSIERLFEDVRRALPTEFQVSTRVCPHFSRGFFPRVANVVAAARRRSEVNHVVGDVHYLVLGLPGRRTVLTIHDCAALHRLRGLARAVLRWFWFTLPVRRAAVVTVVSQATRDDLLHWVRCDPHKIRVVPNCVGPEFTPVPRTFATDEPVVLQVGTAPNKNLERVAAALRGMTCRLVIVGDLSAAQRHALEQERVRFTCLGQVPANEVVRAYRECDLVVFASLGEGFGLPIIEAQAVGRPVVTSDRAPMSEVAGGAACLVNPESVESIRRGIERVCRDDAHRCALVESGFENARRYSPARVAAGYAAIYAELAATR